MSDRTDKPPGSPLLAVGIGASAGGLQAFRKRMTELLSDSGMAFVVIQHPDPMHSSLLQERLLPCTDMLIRDAVHGDAISANVVYVIKPGYFLAVRNGRIDLSEPTLLHGARLPVDHLFRSLAMEYRSRAVGIVLSGTGSDGSSGLRDIKSAGGLTIAQDLASSGYSGMPQSAVNSGYIDLVLSIDEIPKAIKRFASLPESARLSPLSGSTELTGLADAAEAVPADSDLQRSAPAESTSPDSGIRRKKWNRTKLRSQAQFLNPSQSVSLPERAGSLLSHVTLDAQDLDELDALLTAHLDFDLTIYKPRTVQRRVLRRMLLGGFEAVSAYLDYLRSSPPEQQAMVRDLLISVTSFFRDPAAYAALQENVIEPALATLKPDEKLRVWVAGCATGEEAYSIGMLILDAATERDNPVALQMFATDIDQIGLTIARQGIYSPSAVENISTERLQRYFETLDGKGYRVRPVLRDVVSFAVHDLTRDPPFSRMHLVSCRNVMIYLTRAAQQHVLGSLHFALGPQGCLLLSNSEAPGAQPGLFKRISKAAHIYTKTGTSRPVVSGHSASFMSSRAGSRISKSRKFGNPVNRDTMQCNSIGRSSIDHKTIRHRTRSERQMKLTDPARQIVLQALVPPTLIVNATGHVVFLHGELGPFLQFPQGEKPGLQLGTMLRRDFETRIPGALYRCRRDETTVVVLVRTRTGKKNRVRITARPASALGPDCVMLTFEEIREDAASTDATARDTLSATPSNHVSTDSRYKNTDTGANINTGTGDDNKTDTDTIVQLLEEELKNTREDLRTTVEELDSVNEELRSSNEESMSINEELQSSNEELEASTEELQSLNEELSTVNVQLREKIEQLETNNNDLQNFFASACVPIVFFDRQLRINRFTPAAAQLLGIDQGDAGRFTGDIARELLQHDLEQEARQVLSTRQSCSRDLFTSERRWFSRRILPYLTENQRVEGVIVTLTDITDLKRTTELLAVRENQQRVISRLGLRALRKCDLQQFMDHTVREVMSTLNLDYCKILELQPGGGRLLLRAGLGWNEGLVGSGWVDTSKDSQAGYTLSVTEPVIVKDLLTEPRFSGPSLLIDHRVTSGLSCVIRYGEQVYGVIGGHTRNRRDFSKEDSDFMQAVANIIGTIFNSHETRWRRRLESLIASTLADSGDVDGMLDAALVALTVELNCDASELWWTDGAGKFTCRRLHTMPQVNRRDIEQALTGRDITSGFDVVERVRRTGHADWTTDIGEPGLFDNAPGLQNLGFTSGFGFPIREGDSLKGIITLYSRRRMFANDLFLNTLEMVGTNIGTALNHLRHEEREVRLAAITAASQDAILSHDPDGRITEWLSGAEQLFGYSAEEMIGQSLEKLIPPEQRAAARHNFERVLTGEVMEPFETLRITRDQRLIEVSAVSSLIRSVGGTITGVTSTERDISRLKDTERRLLNADQQKNEFLAMLGHELRNPLSSMRTAAELLKHCATDDPEVQYAQEVFERQTAHMAKLLDGLLDVSRIVHGKISLDTSTVDFVSVCREVLADSSERAVKSGLTIKVDLPPHPLTVEADRLRLVQIVDNILSNALRYTPRGGSVQLSLREEHGKARLTVNDDGVGIERDVLPRIFDVFWQSRQNLDRARGGLGIGLSLVRTLAELHGGEIDAHSEGAGRGAEFTFRMPISSVPMKPRSRAKADSSRSLKILIIEDNRDSADMISRVLTRYGHVVTTRYDGTSGMECARLQRPDVVLCDLGLPDGITGYDIARELSGNADTSSIKLIALSGYGEPEVKTLCLEIGFRIHLTKPVSVDELMSAVSGVAELSPA